MAQIGALINIVKTKLEFVKSQACQLHGLLDTLINKEMESITENTDTENQSLNKIRETNSRLDIVLEFLLGKCADIDNFTCGLPVDHQQYQQLDGSLSTSSDLQKFLDRFETLELAKHEQEIKLHTFEEKLENLMTEIADKEIVQSSNSGKLKKKRKVIQSLEADLADRLENIEVKLQNLDYCNSKLSEDLDARICSVKDHLKFVDDEFFVIKISHQRTVDETHLLKKTAEDLATQFDKMKAENAQVVESLADLSSKVDTVEEIASSCRTNADNQLTELQDRICVVEDQRHTDLDYYKLKLGELDTLYKQVCEMVASKISPLRRLQDILSKYHKTVELQEEVALQVGGVKKDSKDSSQGGQSSGSKKQRVPVGFTAYWGDYPAISVNTTLIFTDVLCNEGNCYNSTTGHFTAPYSGLYIASLTLRQRDAGTVNAHVRLARFRHFTASKERTVCKLLTNADKTSCCDSGVVRMKAGDKLLVSTVEVESKPRLSFYSSFSCIFIG